MTSLDGQVAIVTGSARGIGRAAARMLAAAGARVVISDLDEAMAGEVAAELGDHGLSVPGDLTRDGEPERLVRAAVDAWGRLDIVVNNAGYTLDAPVHKMSDDAFHAMLDIHTIAPFRLLRAAAPWLRDPAKAERDAGVEVFRKVVNVSSLSGTAGNAGQANYAAGKAAIVGLTKTLAKEWGRYKINVNAVAFGFIETRLTSPKTANSFVEIGSRRAHLGVPDALRSGLADQIPLGRAGTAEEAAAGIYFLCSPLSNYVTGQVLNVSGGLFVGMDC